MTTPLTPSPQIVQLSDSAPRDQVFHVLPNLAVRDEPAVWSGVMKLLLEQGLTRAEALRLIRFAYTGSFSGQLPPGCA